MTVAERTSRVMHVITGLDTGGAETQLLHLVGARRKAGADDRVVSMIAGGSLRTQFERAGVPVHDLGMTRGRPSLRALLRLIALYRRYKPHLVQSWMYHADLMALFALRISGRWEQTPLIWGIRCSDMNLKDYGRSLRWTVRLCARYSHLPDVVIANSEAGLEAHHKLGYRPFRSRVIDNGIDTQKYRPDTELRAEVRAELGIDPNVPLVAQVARVDPMKDYETLLGAMEKIPDVALLLIGLGTEQFNGRAGCFGLGRRSDVARLLTAADLIVSSSAYGEGFSNALAEGMAAGLPAIATDVGDAVRIVGDSGRIVPPRDMDALAAAIHELAFEPLTFRAARKLHARTLIEKRFSIAENFKNYEQIYASLV
ncbi:MAG: glycosyltransferase [Rhodospirillaceae bacterium]|jgi:glycosyltransferase involved in cell wall biosynthesis|nr:glycosyltransferase [Rhodospirillaceae bacterium]MBT4426207.1 glycosyltransferase [Rhodospirillaceae bacterium]MBT5037634.1 glycosyltransferase [Rhodospirillaceae bacterium]MBT5675408.1 glycosyltransferase [Rhodospirillaceae bacterium]MBT5778414.1 glycosyltransferase [Rhodospirillaceae bacterium]